MTCAGRDTFLQHALVGHIFYMHWSGCSFTPYPSWNAVSRHALVGTQFNDMPWPRHSFTTWHGQTTVLRHTWISAHKTNHILHFPCLIMFPQSTAVYFIRNCTNFTYIKGCKFYMMRSYCAPNWEIYQAKILIFIIVQVIYTL